MKLREVGREELAELHIRYELMRRLLGLLPNGVGGRIRGFALRFAGFRLDRGVILADVPRIGGTGPVCRRLSVGRRSYVNVGCYFDLNGEISIGENVGIGHEVMILTATHASGDDRRRAGSLVSKPVRIADGAWIGARTLILPGVAIGRGAVVGAGSVVTNDVAAKTIVAGVPARPLGEPHGIEAAASGGAPCASIVGRMVTPAQHRMERRAGSSVSTSIQAFGQRGVQDTARNAFVRDEVPSGTYSDPVSLSMGKGAEPLLGNARGDLEESVERLEGQLQRLEPRSDSHACGLSDPNARDLVDASRTDGGGMASQAGNTNRQVLGCGAEGELLDFVGELSAWSEVAAIRIAGARQGVTKLIVELADRSEDPRAPTVVCRECGSIVPESNDAVSHGLCQGCRDTVVRAGQRAR